MIATLQVIYELRRIIHSSLYGMQRLWYSDHMQNNESVISTLLPMVQEDELRTFVQEQAEKNSDFSIKLSQWLMSKYAVYVNKPSTFVDEVRRLFDQQEEKFRGYNRRRYYDGYGLNWGALKSGMEQLISTLNEKLENGHHEVVVLPIVEFYRLLADYLDDFLEEEEEDLNETAHACDALLLKWAEHPEVPAQEKRELYETLQGLSQAEILNYVNGLTDAFFMNYLTCTQSPEEALASIEKMTAMGKVSVQLIHKHIALLRQFGRENEALDIIRKNLRYSSVLDAELNRLYDRGDDYAALNLLDMATWGNNHADAAIEARKIRFLLRLNDTQKLIDVYRYIMLNTWDSFGYYAEIKALVPASEWPEQYRRIVEEGGKKESQVELMACIYAEECDYPRLFEALRDYDFSILSLLKQHLSQLPQEYHATLLHKELKNIEKETHRANKRSEYAHIASLIRQFSALPGAKPMADELVAILRKTYSRRRAYIDELSKL